MRYGRETAFAWILVSFLTGCASLSKKNKPVDINENMPEVSEVVAEIQAAIDATAGHAWKPSPEFNAAQAKCDSAKRNAKAICTAAYDDARSKCRKENGATAPSICGDYLRDAGKQCPPAGWEPDECVLSASLGPLKIKSVKFQFSAAAGRSAGGGASLKLISGKMARKVGRASSFVIEMTPRPEEGAKRLSTDNGQVTLADNLEAVLIVALKLASSCQPLVGDDKRLACEIKDAPQLAFRKATYSLDLSYEDSKEVGFKWSISSLKLVDGSFSAGSEYKLGNTLTVEIER